MKRLPSMIAPMLLVLAVLSTSAVKPVEYVRISPSRSVGVRENADRRQARCPRRTHPSAISALRQRASAEERLEAGIAVGQCSPAQLELPGESRERPYQLLAAPLGKDMIEDR